MPEQIVWSVGQTVYRLRADWERRGAEVREERIEKIGRRWATMAGEGYARERFDVATGWIDGGGPSSPGQVFPDRDSVERFLRKRAAVAKCFLAFNRLGYRKEWALSPEEIESIAAMLERA